MEGPAETHGLGTQHQSTTAQDVIRLEPPSKYTTRDQDQNRTRNYAPLEWLARCWSVTHSTLDMWRSARNVRITYSTLPGASSPATQIDDLVEYEPSGSDGKLKSVHGVDTEVTEPGTDLRSWKWRGKGWLFFVTSKWEILGWGERKDDRGDILERWVVTWFAPTLFTKEGIDFYSDRREGMSPALYDQLLAHLKQLHLTEGLGFEEKPEWKKMVHEDMRPVEIKLPWVEK